MISFNLSILTTLLVGLNLNPCKAHRSLPPAITCGEQFSSPDSPLVIPNPEISWANYGMYTCEYPVSWFEAAAEENQELKFTVTVPVLERFKNVRMTVVIIGPGLQDLPDDDNMPDSVKEYAKNNALGGVIYKSPIDQSTCDHLTSPEMIKESTVIDDRCFFYEPFSGTNNWVVMDEIFTVSNNTEFKIAFYEENGTTAKASFACCDWPEDFATPYPIPESECPACGSTDNNWIYVYYETGPMAEYGGFPAIEVCPADPGPTEYPSGDQCPPDEDDDDVPPQPESCNLGCSSDGECHSHNALGGCVQYLDWDTKPMFGNAHVKNVIIFKGDTIQFKNPSTIMPHNLYCMANETALEMCDFNGSTEVANVGEISFGYDILYDEAGTFYYSCSIGNHCLEGQKLTVVVKDATEGLECHDHEQDDPYSPPECSSTAGLVNARAVDNPSYGAMNANECSDFCMFGPFLEAIPDIEAGTCGELGFTNNATTKTIRPPGSPLDVEVTIVSNQAESICHCHSYEEIPCPEDETPEDTIYAEHIDEIQTFCTGILDGTDDVCPYKCFQPMEVLHLHYLACPSREVDPTYEAVEATNMCHIAAPSPDGEEGCKEP